MAENRAFGTLKMAENRAFWTLKNGVISWFFGPSKNGVFSWFLYLGGVWAYPAVYLVLAQIEVGPKMS